MRLGRLPHDPARLATAPMLAARSVTAIPLLPRLDRRAIPFTPGLYRNDELPDCTAVALANSAAAFAALRGYALPIAPACVPRFYAACIGQPNATAAELAASDGAVMLDVLQRQARNGFDVGQQVPLVADFARCDPGDRPMLARTVTRLGTGCWGLDLYARDMDSAGDGQPWDDDGRDPGPLEGGHAVIAWSYLGLGDTDSVILGTWGRWKPATWRWVHARLREAHALAWRQEVGTVAEWDGLHLQGLAWSN